MLEQEKKNKNLVFISKLINIPPSIKKNKSKVISSILGISGLVIVLGIIVGGALLASHVWNPKWNPFKQNVDKGLKEKIFKK